MRGASVLGLGPHSSVPSSMAILTFIFLTFRPFPSSLYVGCVGGQCSLAPFSPSLSYVQTVFPSDQMQASMICPLYLEFSSHPFWFSHPSSQIQKM